MSAHEVRLLGKSRPHLLAMSYLHLDPDQSWTLSKHLAMQQPHIPFFARTENDRGMRGWPSGSRHHPSGAGTSIGTPCPGNTSASRNIVSVSPAPLSAPRIADRGCMLSRVD